MILMAAIGFGYGATFAKNAGLWATNVFQENKLISVVSGASLLTIFFGVQRSWPLIRNVVQGCKTGFLSIENWFLKSKRR